MLKYRSICCFHRIREKHNIITTANKLSNNIRTIISVKMKLQKNRIKIKLVLGFIAVFLILALSNAGCQKTNNINIESSEALTAQTESITTAGVPGYDLTIHKIVMLGDYVKDKSSYEDACKVAQKYLNLRYSDIIVFEPLASDYIENSDRSLYRRIFSVGGQYSCRFGGIYLKDKIREISVLKNSSFKLKAFKGIYFEFPQLKDFVATVKYNSQEKTGEIEYTYSKDKSSKFKPTLIIEKFDSPSNPVSTDKIIKNINGINYKIWDDHKCNSLYLEDIYMNMDTTIEFVISDEEIYQVSTSNFIYNGIPEREILEVIIRSFKTQ